MKHINVCPVGDVVPHTLAWAATRRPDTLAHLEGMLSERNPMQEAYALLLGIAYAAGRSSVVAELEGTTITEIERQKLAGER